MNNTFEKDAEDSFDRSQVWRSTLVHDVIRSLNASGLVILHAPFGYGKTRLINDVKKTWRKRNSKQRPIICLSGEDATYKAFQRRFHKEIDSCCSLRESTIGGFAEVLQIENGQLGRYNKYVEKVKTMLKQDARLHGDSSSPRLFTFVGNEPFARYIACELWNKARVWSLRCDYGLYEQRDLASDAPLLVIDDLPGLYKDADAAFLCKSIEGWITLGCSIILSIRPGLKIFESYFYGHEIYGPDRLSVSGQEYALWKSDLCLPDDPAIMRITKGVPLLVDACRFQTSGKLIEESAVYNERVNDLLGHTLEDNGTAMAQRIKRALIILQSGTLRILDNLVPGFDAEELSSFAQDYPLFGIDIEAGSFDLPKLSPERSGPLFASIIGNDPRTARACIEQLIAVGETARVAKLARYLPDDMIMRLVADSPYVFCDLSQDDLIERALRYARVSSAIEQRRQRGLAISEILRKCLGYSSGSSCATPIEDDDEEMRAIGAYSIICGQTWASLPAGGEGDQIVTLFKDFEFAALRADRERVVALRVMLNERLCHCELLIRMLIEYRMALFGLVAGMPDEVITWLVPLVPCAKSFDGEPSADSAKPLTLSMALLQAVFSLATVLSRRPAEDADAAFVMMAMQQSYQFFSLHGYSAFIASMGLVEAAGRIATGHIGMGISNHLNASYAALSAAGNQVGQTVALLLQAALNLSTREPAHAQICAMGAGRLADAIGSRHISEIASLLGALAEAYGVDERHIGRLLLRADLEIAGSGPKPGAALLIKRAVLLSLSGDLDAAKDAFGEVETRGSELAIRITCLAVTLMGQGSDKAKRAMGQSLLRDLAMLEEQRDVAFLDDQSAQTRSCPLEIRLLGEMGASLNGHEIPLGAWNRRRARELLACLCLYPGKPLSREQLIDLVWPETTGDKRLGRQKLSQALCALRKGLGQGGGGPEYIVTSRTSVAIEPSLVSVDVEEFERIARCVIGGRNTRASSEVLAMCARVADLYKTGLDKTVIREGQFWDRKCGQFSELFSECMVIGAAVAAGQEDYLLAIHYARAAYSVCPEDREVIAVMEGAMTGLRRGFGHIDASEKASGGEAPQRGAILSGDQGALAETGDEEQSEPYALYWQSGSKRVEKE